MRQSARLGLVLGGGGVRALAHAGVLAALTRAGLAPDVLVGVSMGAVVAATYAVREDWDQALADVDRTKLPAFAVPRTEDESLVRLRSALRSARRLAPSMWTWTRQGYDEYGRATLAALLGPEATFADTRVPLAVIATDLRSGGRAVLTDGDLTTATLASAAIPGLTKPVEREGRMLIDGGFADPSPVDVARDLGADVVVAVHSGQHLGPDEADNWMLALMRGMEIGQRAFAEERLRHADVVLRPDYGSRVHVLDFSVIDDVVRRGAASAAQAIPSIRELLAETAHQP